MSKPGVLLAIAVLAFVANLMWASVSVRRSCCVDTAKSMAFLDIIKGWDLDGVFLSQGHYMSGPYYWAHYLDRATGLLFVSRSLASATTSCLFGVAATQKLLLGPRKQTARRCQAADL